jgi:hypothetical protein
MFINPRRSLAVAAFSFHLATNAPQYLHRVATSDFANSTVPSTRRQCDQDAGKNGRGYLLFISESTDVLGRHRPGAAESGKTIFAHCDSRTCRPIRRLKNQVANHSPQAAVLIPGDRFGRGSHNIIIA